MTTKQETDAHVIMPDQGVFDTTQSVFETSLIQQGFKYNVYDRTEYPESGGIYVYYKGLPYPRKGFPYPEAVWANDVMKRITLAIFKSIVMKETIVVLLVTALLPWKIKIKILEKFLHNYARISNWLFQQHILKLERYSNPCRSIYKVTDTFLRQVGIHSGRHLHGDYLSKYIGLTIATLIEYDDAYRYRFEDLMSETTKYKLIKKPLREMRRLLDIFMKRETYENVQGNIKSIKLFATIALLHPKIRKAFRNAIRFLTDEEFKNMQFELL